MELGTLALLRAQAAHKLIKTLQAGIHWKGNVNTYADLPSSVTELDAYTVLTSTEGHSAGIYAYINNIWKFFLTCLELDQALSIASEKAISNKAVATKFNSVDSSIDSLRQSLEQASSEFRVALEAEATARTDADTALSTALEETKTAITEEITRIHSELENKSKVIASKSSVTGAPTLRAINIDGEDYNIPEGGSGGGVSQDYVDKADAAVKAYADTKDIAVWEKVTERFASEEQTRSDADNALQVNINNEANTRDAADIQLQKNIDGEALARENADNSIKADIEVLKDTSATKNELSNETKARQDKDTELEAAIANKSKVTGTASGENWDEIEIDGVKKKIPQGGTGPEKYLKTITKDEAGVVTVEDESGNKTVFQTGGGSGGGVTQEYVDKADQANYEKSHNELVVVSEVVDTIAAQLEEEKSTRRNEDNYIKEDLITETNRAKAAEEQVQKNIDAEVSARSTKDTELDEKITAEKDRAVAAEKAQMVTPSGSAVEGAPTIKSMRIGANNYNFPEGGSGDVSKEYVDAADALLQQHIDEEATARSNADEVLRITKVSVMDAPTSTTLTDEQLTKITSGVFINGTFLELDNPIFYPAEADSNTYVGMVIGKKGNSTTFNIYKIDSSKKISIAASNRISLTSAGGVSIYNPYFYGTVRMGGLKVQEVATPEADTDGANKGYVDTSVSGKESSSNKSSTMEQSDTKYPSCNAVINYIASLNGDNDEF